MRPHKLTLEGFTSFRDKVELDFSGLDLFAITGPTGAGKSSLIDAICFALYGQVPRVGDDYKQLISHGAERLSVQLDFGVGKERYRVVRTARPDKPSQQRLERITGDAAEPIADRVKEIRTEVDRILGGLRCNLSRHTSSIAPRTRTRTRSPRPARPAVTQRARRRS